MSEQKVIIYTDGAASGNPGPGGYGVVMIWGKHLKKFSKGYRLTTNNRMELMAVIAALKMLKRTGLQIEIFTDSNYVVKAIKEGWLKNWIRNGFKKGTKQIKNKDLWTEYASLAPTHKINLNWVKGHADNEMNNLCDELATSAARGKSLPPDIGYEAINSQKDGLFKEDEA
ncbi:MAG: ribonuclease HI [Bacteroidetes bacterium]|nr:ribonuclease HI [Bacteroidota bacterium]